MLRKKKMLQIAVGLVSVILFIIIIDNGSDKTDTTAWQCSTVLRHTKHTRTNNSTSQSDYTIFGEEVSSRKLEYRCDDIDDECKNECKRNDRDAMIKRDILNCLPKAIGRQVAPNLRSTPRIKGANARASKKWETACPYQIRASNATNRIQRLPDAICLGTHKAGTGALSFLDCHPNLVCRILEPNAYPQTGNRARLYYEGSTSTLPKASPDEFLIEKSPFYAERFIRPATNGWRFYTQSFALIHKQRISDLIEGNYETVKRAVEMKRTNPNVKLFIHVTDPVKRMYSHITQIFRPNMSVLRWRLQEYESADEAIKVAIDYIKMIESTENLVESYIEYLTTGERRGEIGWFLRSIIQIGNYYDTIRDYESVFGDNAVYVVDTENEILDPSDEFGRLLEHFGLDQSLIQFKFDEDKGFHCLEKPMPFCLSKEKGHRGSKRVDIYDTYPDLSIVKYAYKDQMFKLFKHIYHCETEQSCCNVAEVRFGWIKTYFC